MPSKKYPDGEDASTHPGGLSDEERALGEMLPPRREHEGLTEQGIRGIGHPTGTQTLSPFTPGVGGFLPGVGHIEPGDTSWTEVAKRQRGLAPDADMEDEPGLGSPKADKGPSDRTKAQVETVEQLAKAEQAQDPAASGTATGVRHAAKDDDPSASSGQAKDDKPKKS